MPNKPLAGIRVIDLTRVLAGPFCSKILRDLGAEIIKIESPNGGDDARRFGPFLNDDPTKSAYFISVNCDKKSVSLDLKTSEGKHLISQLIKKSDVLLENYRPGVLERLGFSRRRLSILNPSLIYASISGFGHSGPEKNRPAYDTIIQALSGLMSITGDENGEPARAGTSISDLTGGLYAAVGILSALFRLNKTGQGAAIDIAMLDSSVSILENAVARYQSSNENPRPLGSRHPSIAPFESFQAKDDRLVIAAGNDKLFARLCRVIEQPQLANDERFNTNSQRVDNCGELKEIINSALSKYPASLWLNKLDRENIPCAKVNSIEDLFQYRQIEERNMLIPVEGEDNFKIAGNPIKFFGEKEETSAKKAPSAGEHNQEILEGILGYSKEEINDFRRKGVLGE